MDKAQGLSLNTMAIAALVLIVVAVVLVIFGNTLSDSVPFLKQQNTCTARGGECSSAEACNSKGGTPIFGLDCSETKGGEYCCIQE